MNKKLWGVLAFVLVVLSGIAIGRMDLLAVPGVTLSLSANPLTFSGNCPVQVTFTLSFHVTGPSKIQYHFIDDKGHSSNAGTMNCPAAGAFTATRAVAINGSFSGWMAVRATSPVVTQSNRVTLQINCQLLNINEIHWLHCNIHQPNLRIDLHGTFGPSQGTKQVRIGNLSGWVTDHWAQDNLEVYGPFNIVPWTQTYPITIADGNQTVSNTFMHRFPYCVRGEGGSPSGCSVTAGSIISISVFGLPPTQGSLVFKLRNQATAYPLEVVSWTPPYVQLRAPNTHGFSGHLDIFDGNLLASDDYLHHFSVTII